MTPLRFGKYKGKPIDDVPKAYLKWCVENNVLRGKQMIDAKEILDYPKKKYKVVIEGSLNGNGIYYIYAHSKKQALNLVKKENRIKRTQDYRGITYTVTLI